MHLLQFGLIAVCESLLQGIWSVGSALQAATPISWHWRSSMDNHWPHVNLELLRCSGFKLLSPVSCRLHYSSNAKHVMTCYFDPWDLKPSSFHVRRKVYANNYLYNHHSFKGQQENDPSWSRMNVWLASNCDITLLSILSGEAVPPNCWQSTIIWHTN